MISCQNSHTQTLRILDTKLNALYVYLQSAPQTGKCATTVTTPGPAPTQGRDEADENDTRTIIRMMASPLPAIRAKANYVQCLEALGFPITTCPEDVSIVIIWTLLSVSVTLHYNLILALLLLERKMSTSVSILVLD